MRFLNGKYRVFCFIITLNKSINYQIKASNFFFYSLTQFSGALWWVLRKLTLGRDTDSSSQASPFSGIGLLLLSSLRGYLVNQKKKR